MYQLSEVLNLIFDSIGLLILIRLFWLGLIPKYKYLLLGFLSIWFSNIFTVVEGFYFPDIFNLLELTCSPKTAPIFKLVFSDIKERALWQERR
ncbi:hypothetical protein LEP1GSC202_2798 [Leptospira yanagawae serovar Saopaulo str. Sao Paulo = ATCC 700523]|uniref:Uncharacterized protein n=1 Tax=Leptospira yanagawae serovar Saopaulo str. Sao Paulo = ATCC 700523 TaxID=1249483 RepID=A0A5E8HBP9_9LEPT|nr:hypothetical protein [Leptospira yanagawae]EOQ88634.1 hypothetical protein LEP1GSC202_2798 [Leptospira yanagawae serovar Saopaulo str. Sao Paulo = ATCC 700523]